MRYFYVDLDLVKAPHNNDQSKQVNSDQKSHTKSQKSPFMQQTNFCSNNYDDIYQLLK